MKVRLTKLKFAIATFLLLFFPLSLNYGLPPTTGPSAPTIGGHLHHAYAADSGRQRPIVLGQTEGWARGELKVFDYTQDFICSNAPRNEADCKVGVAQKLNLTELQLDPAKTLPLFVIVPFFSVDNVLQAFATNPSVFVQCPENQSSKLNSGTEFGSFGHCILHDTMLDTSPLAGVTVAGVALGGTIPLPNHTHIVESAPGGSVPWTISVVLVVDPRIWPDQFGDCPGRMIGLRCLTSFDAVSQAPQGSIVGPVPSTLFLFFGVHGLVP